MKAKTVEEILAIQAAKKLIPEMVNSSVVSGGVIKVDIPEAMVQKTIEINGAGEEVYEPEPRGITQTLGSTETLSRSGLVVSQILENAGINPVQELVDAYMEREDDPMSDNFGKFKMSPGERRSLMKEMLKYTHPQLKNIDHSGTVDNRITVIIKMPDGSMSSQDVAQRGKPIDV